jgi:hypothetical protein
MGHANISITLDRYGHLMPGNEAEAAGLLDPISSRYATARIEIPSPGSRVREVARNWRARPLFSSIERKRVG